MGTRRLNHRTRARRQRRGPSVTTQPGVARSCPILGPGGEAAARSRDRHSAVRRIGKMASVYDEVYRRSLRDPEGFWAAAAEGIHWERRWDRVFDDSRKPFYRWFRGG